MSVRVRSLGWVCGVQERSVRVRCDRGVQERPCEGAVRLRQPCASVPPFHFENLRQGWQKCVEKYGNTRPRPKQNTSMYILLVLKKKGEVFLRGIDRYKSSFDVSINAYFFSKDQRANHLTPHRLINAAPCKPTFSLPHACRGY